MLKIVVYGPERRTGALIGNRVVDLNRAHVDRLRSLGVKLSHSESESQMPTELVRLIELDNYGIDAVHEATEFALRDGDSAFVESPVLHSPWPRRRIACIGGNYAEHLMGMFKHRPQGAPATVEAARLECRQAGMWGFWKVPDKVLAAGDPIPFPRRTSFLDYEGELAVVLRTRAKNISAESALKHVWGVTLLNDMSMRDGLTSPRVMSFNLPKNFDGSTVMGPCILVGEIDPSKLWVETRVNGELRQRFRVGEMIWSFGEIIEYLSRDFTLAPGDVVAGGTSAGTAADSSSRDAEGKFAAEKFLKQGDIVEVSCSEIGSIWSKIVEGDAQ